MKTNNIEQPVVLQQTEPLASNIPTNKRLLTISLQICAIAMIIGSIAAGSILGVLITPYAALIGLVALVISLAWLAIAMSRKTQQPQPSLADLESEEKALPLHQPQTQPIYNFFSITTQDLASTLHSHFLLDKQPSSVTVQGADQVVIFTNKNNSSIKLWSMKTTIGSEFNIIANNHFVARLALIPPDTLQTQHLLHPYHNTSLSTLALSTGICWENALALLSQTIPTPGAWVLGQSNPADLEETPPVVMMWNPFGFYPDIPPYDLMRTHPLHRYTSFEELHTMFYNLLTSLMQAGVHHIAIPLIDFFSPKSFSNQPYSELIEENLDLEPEPRVLLALTTALNTIATETESPTQTLSVYCYTPQCEALSFFSKQ